LSLRLKIYDTDIRPPQANNDNWEFALVVVYEGDTELHKGSFVISDLKLQECAKQALGRYLNTSIGNASEKKDLLENWAEIEPELQAFFEECFKAQLAS